jgi:2',3'-cyclic-nucleotide 2'-phosphodiesterase (5'-nucleotidase family)
MRFLPMLLLVALVSPAQGGVPRVVDGAPLVDPSPEGDQGLQARIFGTTSRLGELEPCECPSTPLGGLAQEGAVVEASRQTGLPTFWVDAGNRLFRHDMAMSDFEEAQRRLKAIILVDSGSVGGLDAAGVGPMDLGAGLDYLVRLAQRASYPVVSANLVDGAGNLVMSPRVMLEQAGLKVGITSVLARDVAGEDYAATDPLKAAREQVATLRKEGADLVLVLSGLGQDADRKLARASKADAVIAAKSRELTAEEVRIGRTVWAEAASRGKYLVDLRWYRQGSGPGPHLVATTLPVRAEGPTHPALDDLLVRYRARLEDPLLGLPGISAQEARGRETRPR